MKLTKPQQEQVEKQLKMHDRDTVKANIPLGKDSLELIIERGVFGSDIMSSGLYLAKFLHEHPKLYKDKTVLDMGCGPGTQGIVMALYGAKYVTLTDISQKAVENTLKNMKNLGLTKKTEAYESDLFLKIDKMYDTIVFNHPFFPEEAENFKTDACSDIELKKTMLGGTELIKRFLSAAPKHLNKGGKIIMPYFHFAGAENDPINHAEDHGLKVIDEKRIESEQGLQLGDFSIYLIRIKITH